MRAAPWHWCGTHSFRRFPTSSTVGYQEYILNQDGFSVFSPIFTDCSSQGPIKLNDIKLVNARSANIQKLTKDGVTLETYYWVDPSEAPWLSEAGWYGDSFGDTAVDTSVQFEFGQGLWIEASSSIDGINDVRIQVSGSVKLGAYEVSINPNGFTPIGNALPVKISLMNIKLVNARGGNIQKLTKDGVTVTTYYWVEPSEAPWLSEAGWYGDSFGDIAIEGTVGFEPGEGIWFESSDAVDTTSDVKVQFSVPE